MYINYSLFKKSCAVLICFLIFHPAVVAQQNHETIDSLIDVSRTLEGKEKVDAIIAISDEYVKNRNADSILQYANMALELAQSENYIKGEAYAFEGMGYGFYYSYKVDSAILYYNKALDIFTSLNDSIQISNMLTYIGNLYSTKGNQPLALEYFSQGLSIAKDDAVIAKIKNGMGIASAKSYNYKDALIYLQEAARINKELKNHGIYYHITGNITNIHTLMGNYTKAATYIREVIQKNKEMGDTTELADARSRLGVIYYKMNQIDSALVIFQKNILMDSSQIVPHIRITALLYTGRIYLRQAKYDSALIYLSQSLEKYNNINSTEKAAGNMIDIANLYNQIEKPDLAKVFLDKALVTATDNNNYALLGNCYSAYSDMYEISGNYKKAFGNYKLAVQYNDSMVNKENQQNISELEIKYGVELKEAENKILLQDLDAEKTELLRQKTEKELFSYAFIGILIIFLGAIVLFVLYSKWAKQKRKLRLLKIIKLEDEKAISSLKIRNASIEIDAKKNLLTQINESLLLQSQLSNELINSLKSQRKFATVEGKREITMTLSRIHEHMAEDSWKIFERNFVSLYPSFFDNLKLAYPDLSKNDLRLLTFMSRGIKAKEISLVTFQSENSINVAKGRLRAKLNMETNEQMEKYCMDLLVIADDQD